MRQCSFRRRGVEFTPNFVKHYRRLGDEIRAAAHEYAEEVRQGRFPAAEHTYSR